MKASELIKQLEKLIKKHSDLDIKVYNTYGESYEDNFVNINISHIDLSIADCDIDSDERGIILEQSEEHFVIEAW